MGIVIEFVKPMIRFCLSRKLLRICRLGLEEYILGVEQTAVGTYATN